MPLNYSKWDKIDVSDDEDDTHPNIETASLFRMRHQARMEKMADMKKGRESLQKSLNDAEKEVKEKENTLDADANCSLLEDLRKKVADIKQKLADLDEEEKKQPWNVDTISKPGFNKSLVNVTATPAAPPRKELTEEERNKESENYCAENKKILKEFSFLQKLEDSKRLILQNTLLCSEYAVDYLLGLCLEYGLEEKRNLMEHVAHQAVLIQFMIQCSNELSASPQAYDFINLFFAKLKQKGGAYREMFDDDVENMKKRLAERTAAKRAEIKNLERKKCLGPGGLDPAEVFESLPKEMQECFSEHDKERLENLARTMEDNIFEYHMSRCVASGLWKENKDSESCGKKEGG